MITLERWAKVKKGQAEGDTKKTSENVKRTICPTLDRFADPLFHVFQTIFRIDLEHSRGQFRSADVPP